jgi:hypothetical protein
LKETWQRSAVLLLQAVRTSAVRVNDGDHDIFIRMCEQLEKELDAQPESGGVMLATGSAISALRDYNRTVERYVRGRSAEFHGIISLLTLL